MASVPYKQPTSGSKEAVVVCKSVKVEVDEAIPLVCAREFAVKLIKRSKVARARARAVPQSRACAYSTNIVTKQRSYFPSKHNNKIVTLVCSPEATKSVLSPYTHNHGKRSQQQH